MTTSNLIKTGIALSALATAHGRERHSLVAKVSCLFLALSAAACRTPASTGTKSDIADDAACKVYVPPSLQAEFAKSTDALKQSILTSKTPGACVRTSNRFKDVHTMLKLGSCGDNYQRYIVSEEGHYRSIGSDGGPVAARFVDRADCFENLAVVDGNGATVAPHIFLSGSGPATKGFEIIAEDPAQNIIHFYTQTPGPNGDADFSYHGHTFHQAVPSEMNGTTKSHPCTRCHINGSLVMKELRADWTNWHEPRNQGGSGAEFPDPVTIMKNTDQGIGARAAPNNAAGLENFVKTDQARRNAERIRRLKAGQDFFSPPESTQPKPVTLAQILKPLFCETEVVIGNMKIDSGASLRGDLQLNRLLMPVQEGFVSPLEHRPVSQDGVPSLRIAATTQINTKPKTRLFLHGVSVGGDDFTQIALVQNGVRYKGYNIPIGSAIDYKTLAKANHIFAESAGPDFAGAVARVGEAFPARSFVDDDFVHRLVAEGLVEEKLAIAVLMVDFPNPVFSAPRCNLLGKLPDVALSTLRDSTGAVDAKRITQVVADAVRGSSDGDQVLANMAETNDKLARRVSKYLDRCRTGEKRLKDAASLHRLLRAKQQRLVMDAGKFALEPFTLKMFAEAPKLRASEFAGDLGVGLNEDCGLNNP